MAECTAAGAALVSVNPVHSTLEDVFVQMTADAPSARDGALS